MKSLRWVVLLAAVLAVGRIAKADTDPAIGVKGGGGSPGIFTINAPDPLFNFDVFGGAANGWTIGSEQDFDFINATGFTATELDLLITPINGALLTYICGDSSFYTFDCSATPQPDGGALIKYTLPAVIIEGGPFIGIPNAADVSCDGHSSCGTETPGADFAISVRDVGGDLVNLDSTEGFHVQGTLIASVPEPSSILLISTGMVSMGLLRRRRRRLDKTANSLS